MDISDSILLNYRIVVVPDNINTPLEHTSNMVRIYFPTAEQRYKFQCLRELNLQKSIDSGLKTEKDTLEFHKDTSCWSDEQQKIIDNGPEHLKFLSDEIASTKNIVKKKNLIKQLKDFENKYNATYGHYLSIVSCSAEYVANKTIYDYSIFLLCKDNEGCPLFNSESAFISCQNEYPEFIAFLGEQIATPELFGVKEIRKLARSSFWRILWSSCKDNLYSLFNFPAKDLNIYQLTLVMWSRLYDSVFEDPNRPPLSVIEDDDQLDEWLENKNKESSKKSDNLDIKKANDHHENLKIIDGYYSNICICGIGNHKAKGLGEQRRHDDSCSWGRWIAYSQEEKDNMADKIFAMNTTKVQEVLHKEFDKIASSNLIEEQKLRDKKSRIALGSNVNHKKIYR